MKQLSELNQPAPISKMPMLESEIQSRSVEWVRSRGYWARKFSSLTQRSVPDYLFAGRGLKFAVEFKREDAPVRTDTGCMSTPAQVDEQKAMREVGWLVWEENDVEHFKRRVLAIEEGRWP